MRWREIAFQCAPNKLHHTRSGEPMSFDTSTLYLFATMVAGMLGAMLLMFGKQENIPALKWWGTAYLLGASSVAIWTIGGAALGEPLLLALHALPIMLGSLLRPHDETFTSSIWVTAFSIELVLYAIGTVFVIFMLVSDRAVTVHKTAASVDPLSGMLNRRGFTEASNRVIER